MAAAARVHFGRLGGIAHHAGSETVPQAIASHPRLGKRSTGPVLRCALRRLAAILASDVMTH